MEMISELAGETLSVCGFPEDRVEIVATFEKLLPDSNLTAKIIAKCR